MRKFNIGINKSDVLRYFLELLLVIVGVTIAFMLTNWAEKRSESQARNEYLETIKKEIIVNIGHFENGLKFIDERKIMFERLQKIQPQMDSIEVTEDLILRLMMDVRKLVISTSSWDALKQSGNFRLIKDIELQNDLSKLYSFHFFQATDMHKGLNNWKGKLTVYYAENKEIGGKQFSNRLEILSAKTYNYFRTYYHYHDFLEERIKRAIEESKRIIKKLNIER